LKNLYFTKVKKEDELYSLIYGTGNVTNVVPKNSRLDGFYIFSVKYSDNIIHYTEDGIPNWCGDECGTQTVFYKSDIDFERVDFEPCEDSLSIKKINKLRGTGKLEMRCPSGLWRNVDACPIAIVTKAIKNGFTNIFRKVEYIGKERRAKRG